ADNASGVIRIWTPPGLPVFVLISNLGTTASVYPASWSGVATPSPDEMRAYMPDRPNGFASLQQGAHV
ncbi:hypothetical protein ACEP3G_31140, partial [Pseudomonas aeruginosa]